jgi:hypothetical protein
MNILILLLLWEAFLKPDYFLVQYLDLMKGIHLGHPYMVSPVVDTCPLHFQVDLVIQEGHLDAPIKIGVEG